MQPSIESMRSMVSKEDFELIGMPETSVMQLTSALSISQAIMGPFNLHGHEVRVLLNVSVGRDNIDVQILYIDEDDGVILNSGVMGQSLPQTIKFAKGWTEVHRS